MKKLIIAWAIFSSSSLFGSQGEQSRTFGVIKVWRLHTEHAEVAIKLSNGSQTSLSIRPEGESIPTAAEEASLLRQVLDEMVSLGYNPGNLVMISTWLQKSEFRDGAARAVLQSGKWKSCLKRKYCYQAAPIADQFLSSVDAFKEFDKSLQQYGLKRKAIHVDGIGVGKKGEQILCEGLIVISLEKVK